METRTQLNIKFTKEATRKTRYKAMQLIDMPLTKDQTDSFNRVLKTLSKEELNKEYKLEIIRYGTNIILANTQTIDKWTIFTNGRVIKYP